MMNRRLFVSGIGAAGALVVGVEKTAKGQRPVRASGVGESRFFELIRLPDRVGCWTEESGGRVSLRASAGAWDGGGVWVKAVVEGESLRISMRAPAQALMRVQLRWTMRVADGLSYMGDAWERSYGELAWRTMVPERVMPWYFAAHTGASTHGYGVETGAGALCFWQVDAEGVSLWLDVSNGGSGVLLGERELQAARVVSRKGVRGEDAQDAITALCRKMCPKPRLPVGPVFGTNDWYYAYGKNTAEGILRDTEMMVDVSSKGKWRPFSVIDDGWRGNISVDESVHGNARFPDMGKLAKDIANRGARSGIWIRPLEAPTGTAANLLLPVGRYRSAEAKGAAYDPTIPEAMAIVLEKMTQVVDWGYQLVKHDFSTYELMGQWGSTMGAQPTRAGWHFHDRSRTSAEILLDLYRGLRRAAGENTVLLGCNTVAHLGAGIFEVQRTGDDTSGRNWERTRRMGVNTLAYRLAQNDTFHRVDADCVGITRAIPWKLNRQWMELLARSGTAVFLSVEPGAIGAEERKEIADALAITASEGLRANALDWMGETTPERWEFRGGAKTVQRRFRWCDENGCSPFE